MRVCVRVGTRTCMCGTCDVSTRAHVYDNARVRGRYACATDVRTTTVLHLHPLFHEVDIRHLGRGGTGGLPTRARREGNFSRLRERINNKILRRPTGDPRGYTFGVIERWEPSLVRTRVNLYPLRHTLDKVHSRTKGRREGVATRSL